MTNPHIEIVKKWLNNPDSVSQSELKSNRYAARAASDAASAAADAADLTAYHVKKYEEITK